ncbi:hypothetical protein PANT111_100008 [Pantoea brenneri]|uniref:Uncharacterized protein n=1 Tax=Pantoea brenneri TaxID=472694 RepID=A0AAX3J001_9GAMM|nr:hypothetical protein PANT111_100008 [Pantoea brenneri]
MYEKPPATQSAKLKFVIAIETFRLRGGKFELRRAAGQKKGPLMRSLSGRLRQFLNLFNVHFDAVEIFIQLTGQLNGIFWRDSLAVPVLMVDFDFHRTGLIAEQIIFIADLFFQLTAYGNPAVILHLFRLLHRHHTGVVSAETTLSGLNLRRRGIGVDKAALLSSKNRGRSQHNDS